MDISSLIVRGFIKIISKWGSFDLLFQSGAKTVISKLVNVYFKVGQLFQSGQLLQSGAKSYFKVGQIFQSGT